MKNIQKLLQNESFSGDSIPGIAISTYFRLWKKESFFAKELNGQPTLEFLPTTSAEFLEQQLYIAAGLLELGLEKGDHVGIYSYNSLRYAVEIFSTLSIGGVFVPVYPTLTMEEALLLFSHSDTSYVFVGDIAQYQKAVAILDKVKSPLKKVIVNFPTDKKHKNVMSYEELLETGRHSGRVDKVIEIIKSLSKEDLAALVYTPGTTGIPKGAMLTHGNFLAQLPVTEHFDITDEDVRLSHLPFSHVFGLSADLFASALFGTTIAISHTFDTEEIVRDIAMIKPTVMCSVPRMYEKLYVHTIHKINRSMAPKRALYNLAIAVGRALYIRKVKGRMVSPFLQMMKALFSIIYFLIRRSINMNKTRILFSGGGPLTLEVAYFYGGIGVPILEGYGLTETSPIVNVNRPGSEIPGTVGQPIRGVEEKISDEGEILIKGPMVFRGYYKDDSAETEEVFTADGFFRTGDVGIMDEEKYLTITSRLKDIIITSAGKNIAPQRIEKMFENDEYIDYFCVVGDKRKYLTALIVPNFESLAKFAKFQNIKFSTNNDLVNNETIQKFFKERIEEVNDNLARYEQIKKFTLLSHGFSVTTGELTMAYKFNRNSIQHNYKELIDKMYPSSSKLE
ncbi:MAG TPA: long-chain fatty acid--CoA ligase [Spirochaetota bacterium]|nr:long-chain fatty acid--CoA ligase [Spirochaetota bacterium]